MSIESEKRTIALIVDDSPDSLGLLNNVLNDAGLTVLVALDGMQAIDIIRIVTPDVILLDAVMPNMNGFETCEKIKEHLPYTPIIFMTGLSDPENIIRGLKVGGVDYVTKPINPEEILARIKVHINNARLATSARNALDSTGQALIAVDTHGKILWQTPSADELLALHLQPIEDIHTVISEALKKWHSSSANQEIELTGFSTKVRASYLNHQAGNYHLIKLIAENNSANILLLQQQLNITKREADVLFWLSKGKSNWDISQILTIKTQTVKKHLEQVYKKLDVDNRTSAAAKALKAISE